MSKGDRALVLALALFVVSVLYGSEGDYFWWAVYLVGTILLTILM